MWKKKIQPTCLSLATLFAVTSCGSQAYIPQSSSAPQTSPGSYQIPAKVDIVLAQSDMGSMYDTYTQLQAQFPSFLNSLQSSGWDYHFAVVPLTSQVPSPVGGVVVSQYDASWGSAWLSSYPGETIGTPGTDGNIQSSLFVNPNNYEGFELVQNEYVSNNNNGLELGLQGIAGNLKTLNAASTTTQLIRSDAMLVVLVVSPMDDDSGLSFTTNQNGVTVLASGETWATGLSNYQADLVTLKSGNPEAVQFFAAVANEQSYDEGCLGSNSWVGTRYQSFASMMGGQSYDLCTGQISGVISGLESSLQATRLNMVTSYLFISSAPNVSTITVTKYPGGDTSNPVVIPQDSVNGWSYIGYQTEYAITSPVPMDQTTGYAIRLNGTAQLQGNDTANVNYTGAGLQQTSG